MPYLTPAQYNARFGEEELAELALSMPGQTVADAIADAESIVDGYLAAVPGRTFVVPLALTAVPRRITELTADLARYELHAKKVTHEIKRRRDQAIAFLEGMVKGLVAIPELLPMAGQPEEVVGGMTVDGCERVFTCETLRGYVG